MKKIIIVIGAVLLSAFLGFLVPWFMNDGTGGVDVAQLQENFEQELATLLQRQAQEAALKAEYEAVYDTMRAEQIANNLQESSQSESAENNGKGLLVDESDSPLNVETDAGLNESVVEAVPSEVMANEGATDLPEESELESTELTISDAISVPEIDETLTAEEEKVVKDQWVQSQINANRDEIDDNDLYSGAEIYNQLDTGYLFGLADGGLTDEERAEAEAYLRANLSEGQLEIALTLYSKYVHLLD